MVEKREGEVVSERKREKVVRGRRRGNRSLLLS